MAEDNDKRAVRSKSRILSMLGIRNKDVQKNVPIQETDEYTEEFSGTFSEQELKRLPGVAAKHIDGTKISAIDGHLKTISDSSKNKAKAIKSYKVLTPEIDKARSILIPSIMSPNDMQSDSITITIDKLEGLDETTINKLGKLLQNYFNDKLNLGVKITEWIGTALFDTGAVPVLVLPKSAITTLAEADELEAGLHKQFKTLQIGTEDLAAQVEASFETLKPIDTIETDSSDLALYDDVTTALESFFDDCDEIESLDKIKVNDIAIETMNTIAAKLKTDGASIKFSTDYRGIISVDDNAREKTSSIYKKIQRSMYGDDHKRLFLLDDEEQLQDGDHPTIIPLPTEAVMPVCVPGAPSTHIGYFVLLDEWGNPLADLEDGDGSDGCSSTVKSSGAEILYNGISGQKLSTNKRFEAASLVFGLTVKKMLMNKLNDHNLDDVTIEHHQAISTILFQRLLRKQRVHIVFVPSNMMSYYAFDYRDNGTGKSLFEDSSFLLSLRTTLVIANVMAAMKNSMDRKRIEFDTGDAAVNHEQIMKIIEDIYVSKRMFRFDHNPMSIVRNLTKQSLSVVPKNLQGMSEFNVTTEEDSRQAAQPDTDMQDKLTEMVVTKSKVPYSVLNQLGENEFSRSVATTNLFFSNDIRAYQRILIPIITLTVKQYTQFSKSLINKIVEIISEASDVANDDSNVEQDKLLRKVLNHIHVSLPSPSVAANKAQYEELRELLSMIDDLMDKLYDDTLIVNEDDKVKDTFVAMRAHARHTVLRQVLNQLGSQSFDIPHLNDIDASALVDMNQRTLNVTENLKLMLVSLKAGGGEEEGGGSSW